MAPIRSINNLSSIFRDRFARAKYQGVNKFIATSTGLISTPPTGLQPGNGYIYHTFIGPGSFIVSGSSATVEVFVVGGGGGGGSDGSGAGGGGGGAGGLVYATSVPLSVGSYPVTVGLGGAVSTNGNDSTFHTLFTAKGGGAGRAYAIGSNPGGSGGGSGARSSAGTAIQPATSQSFVSTFNSGFAGGAGDGNDNAGGGGGAGGLGNPSSSLGPGAGGIGLQFPSFVGPLIGLPSLGPLNGYFAGGGGGGRAGSPTAGGLGGGGTGSGTSPSVATAGTDYTGGGGGGGGRFNNNSQIGGSGIVIVRYPI